ncbi:MAG: AraC family transcriptional regulator [Cyanobacteriota bacterium]
MSQKKTITIDFTQEDASQQILPHPPLLSSQKAGWNGINFEYHRQPTQESPEFCFAQHTITIYVGHLGTRLRVNEHWQSDGSQNGDIYIFPANKSLKVEWDKEAEFIELYLEPTMLAQIADESMEGSCIELVPQLKLCDPLIHQIGLALKSELESDGLGSGLYAESMATALSVHLLRRYSVPKPVIQEYTGGLPRYKLKQAIEYINEHLDKELALAEIAAVVHMSSHYFASLFKQSTGLAPHQYVTKCRVEKAKQLLAKGELTIIEICQQVGFQSQSHFTKVFRKYTATTPKAYRNAL